MITRRSIDFCFNKLFRRVSLLAIVGLLCYVIFGRLENRIGGRYSKIFNEFHECMKPRLEPMRDDPEMFWKHFVNATNECDKLEVFKKLDIRPVANKDETKWILYPKKQEQINMVTLGIGQDTTGEEKLKEIYPNTKFFGADPSEENNRRLYEKIGLYFSVAVSGKSGMSTSHVYRHNRGSYANEVTMNLGAGFFFNEILKEKKIDILWVDTEGNEYTIVDNFHNGGDLDNLGISVCQINIECHFGTLNNWHEEKQKFHDFIWKLLDDGKFVMLRSYKVPTWEFLRIFLVNVQDPDCTQLYIE